MHEIVLAWMMLALWWTLEAIVRIRAQRRRAKMVERISDFGSRYVIAFAGAVSIIVSQWAGLHRVGPNPFMGIGLGLMAVGLLLRYWALWLLGTFYTPAVTVAAGQYLIFRGPYAYIRHPAYTGGWLALTGWALTMHSAVGGLVTAGVMALAYRYRIGVEENALRDWFGGQYAEYVQKTWAFFPGLW